MGFTWCLPKKKIIDDEEEYFPTLKIIIAGIVEASNQKKDIEIALINYSKELYISNWIEYAKHQEINPNIEKETNDSIKQFDKFYCNKQGKA